MPTLLDTAEFALAKATLTETLQRIEKARKDRLESLRRFRAMNQASLENAKRAVRELPNDIARQDAEIAKLEASTADDLLREAVGLECPACNDLEDARQFMEPPREPAESLDLRTCIGAACEAVEDIAGVRSQGQHFIVLEPGNYQTVKIRYALDGRYYECYVGAVQPARLLKQPQPPGEVVEVQSPKPQPEAQSSASAEELFIPGLPPEALRKVWPEWEDEAGDVVTFKDDMYHWAHWSPSTPIKRIADITWIGIKLRPLGTSRAHVEALAQQAQSPKPHACPRCDEGMREVEITRDLYWASPGGAYKLQKGERLRAAAADDSSLVLPGGWVLLIYLGSFIFTHPDVPPPSEWCDGSGKGGAE